MGLSWTWELLHCLSALLDSVYCSCEQSQLSRLPCVVISGRIIAAARELAALQEHCRACRLQSAPEGNSDAARRY